MNRGPWFISPEDAEARLRGVLLEFAADCHRLFIDGADKDVAFYELRRLYTVNQILLFSHLIDEGALTLKEARGD